MNAKEARLLSDEINSNLSEQETKRKQAAEEYIKKWGDLKPERIKRYLESVYLGITSDAKQGMTVNVIENCPLSFIDEVEADLKTKGYIVQRVQKIPDEGKIIITDLVVNW